MLGHTTRQFPTLLGHVKLLPQIGSSYFYSHQQYRVPINPHPHQWNCLFFFHLYQWYYLIKALICTSFILICWGSFNLSHLNILICSALFPIFYLVVFFFLNYGNSLCILGISLFLVLCRYLFPLCRLSFHSYYVFWWTEVYILNVIESICRGGKTFPLPSCWNLELNWHKQINKSKAYGFLHVHGSLPRKVKTQRSS